MFLLKPSVIKREMWGEIEPYLVYLAVIILILYILHQCISYLVYKKAIKKGTLEAMKEYENRKKI